MEQGTIDILNTGAGHLELHFNPADPIESDRAKRAVMDMLRRGYSLFVYADDGTIIPVERYDPVKNVYIIGNVSAPVAVAQEPEPDTGIDSGPLIKSHRGRPPKYRKVDPTKVKTTAIGRSAGG